MLSPVEFIHQPNPQFPPEVKQAARAWLLDWIGVAAAGTTTELSRIITDHANQHFASNTHNASLVFDGRSVSPVGAALANGMTVDSIDAHDGHKLTKGHVGCGLIAGLLAFAEAESEIDLEAFLDVLIIGYEIGTRAGIALHQTATDYHTSGAWVAVSVAAVGARILGLSEKQTFEALGIAEYHGPRSPMMRCIDHPTMLKDGSGYGAMAGVSAAYLARDGFTGSPALLITDAQVSPLWASLGRRWCITEQYFKPFPVCRWAQPSVQAALNLRIQHQITGEQVAQIEITTFHQAIRLAVREPKTTEQAQYSTAFPVASALVFGELGPAQIQEAALDDPEVLRLSRSIQFAESAAFNDAFPANRFAQVNLHLKDGRVLRSPPTEPAGDPENPVSIHELRSKFVRYAAPVIGPQRADELARRILDGPSNQSMADIQSLLFAPI